MKFKIFLFFMFLGTAFCFAFESNHLLYFEAQTIGGYSSQDDVIYYSAMPDDPMQKNSVGFDYLSKLSTATGDFGTLALQGRLAWDDNKKEIDPQLYNAYFKYKTSVADVWIGHDRPALGLSSYFDTHDLLLPTLVMYGYGFDRDWGVGAYRDYDWGNAAFSATLGSGMEIRDDNNYLISGRISKGVLNRDNYNLGFSAAYKSEFLKILNLDLTVLYNNFENRTEVAVGEKEKDDFKVLFNRSTLNLMDEGKLKLEGQVIWSDVDLILGTGISYILTNDLTMRTMYEYSKETNNKKVVLQLYYYLKI